MNWYYAENGEKRGPVEFNTWTSLVSNGTITPETLVWREGMKDWQPYSQVARGAVMAPAGVLDANTCSECGNHFQSDDLVEIEGRNVCAGCKPLILQKLKEGTLAAGFLNYAGFWIRFGAKFIDGIILFAGNFVIQIVAGIAISGAGDSEATATVIGIILIVAQLGIQVVYTAWFIGKFGATPGKMACGLKVVMADGTPVGYGRAVGRVFAEWVSGIILYIGYLMVAWDPEKRALHDRICSTRVIRAR
jgi:uncharacterized RDD family membrane protein YckC